MASELMADEPPGRRYVQRGLRLETVSPCSQFFAGIAHFMIIIVIS